MAETAWDRNDSRDLHDLRAQVAGIASDVKGNRDLVDMQHLAIVERLEDIIHAVEGNGKPGLRERVERMEGWKNKVIGAVAAIVVLSRVVEWGLNLLSKGLHL